MRVLGAVVCSLVLTLVACGEDDNAGAGSGGRSGGGGKTGSGGSSGTKATGGGSGQSSGGSAGQGSGGSAGAQGAGGSVGQGSGGSAGAQGSGGSAGQPPDGGAGAGGAAGAQGSGGAAGSSGSAGAAGTGDTYLPWENVPAYYGKWTHGPPNDPNFFPIAVWLQTPSRAAEYAGIGINVFIGLYGGPTDAQLTTLRTNSMPTICEQTGVWSSHLNDTTIWGWMHQDEPDNAQSNGMGGYDPCITPANIISGYQRYVANDATRPVYLNLGKGVSDENWVGRGTCTGRLDMYAEYIKGADIVSFDIYPMNDTATNVHGNLWYVPRGIDRLREYAQYKKPVWNWIETTGFDAPANAPTPAQVKTEVWMSIIHGSLGIGYFAHIFMPSFIEAGLLSNAAMKSGVAAINQQIKSLAPVLNTPPIGNAVTVSSSNTATPVDILVKRRGSLHVFAVAMRSGTTTATFTLRGVTSGTATVLGESRTIPISNGRFSDAFAGYAVHLYQIGP